MRPTLDADPAPMRPRAAEPDGRTPDIWVIVNAGSGKKLGEAGLDVLRRAFDSHPGRFDLRVIRRGADIEREAREAARAGFSTVAAAGGDGTINAVASALAAAGETSGTRPRLGVIPLGTFNYVARSLGIPEDAEAAVDLLATAPDRPLPLGEVNGRVFLNNASLGAYASILETRETVYGRWGRSRIAAHWSVVTTLAQFRHPLTARVTVDGEARRVRTPMAFVANNGFQLEQFGFHEAAERVRDGEFALFLAPDVRPMELIRFALDLALGQLVPGRDFELVHGRDILVETRSARRLVARDGERSKLDGPFRFRRIDAALRVVAPEAGAMEAGPAMESAMEPAAPAATVAPDAA